jgi:ATP-dependent Lhr-like helicase
MDWLLSAARGGDASPEPLSHSASDVARVLKQRGAAFYQELVQASGRLPSEVEDALWELVAKGIATADGISNLRVLQSAKQKRRQRLRGRGGPGRWSLLSPLSHPPAEEVLDKLARLFLSRYGVVFRDILARESLAPPWRELLPVYRRLEARGEIRGGRFLAGFAGEQFAMPEAVDMGRAVRRAGPTGNRVRLSAVDPLNLTGIITPGPRVAATLGNWVTYVDGIPETATSDSEPAGEWAAGSTGIH